MVAADIAAETAHATVILTGRSALDSDGEAKLAILTDLGLTVEYVAADMTDRQSVDALFSRIKFNYGQLTGIIHSAGVIRDDFIINKSVEQVRQVLAPKVAGLVHLDEASAGFDLQHFVCFSSMAALGNSGQADYAAANAFMDSYMRHRQTLVAKG